VKQVVPFLKVDKGLEDESDGVQVMKPMPDLDPLLARAREKGVFGTKMRSVVKLADKAGVQAIADQQFEVGRQILDAGLVPILEPEVDIKSPQKAEAEALLRDALLAGLDSVPDGPRSDVQADAAGDGRLLPRARRAPQGAQGGGAVGWLLPRGGQRPAGPEPRGGGQLLARAHRGPQRPAVRRRLRRRARRCRQASIYEASVAP
jgi:hypothetical protein